LVGAQVGHFGRAGVIEARRGHVQHGALAKDAACSGDCREGLVDQTTRRELVPASPFGGHIGAACVAVMVCIRSSCG
jgi:hypothetical protein